MIPSNGLTVSSDDSNEYFYVTVKKIGVNGVKVELFANSKTNFIITLMDKHYELLKNLNYEITKGVYSYYKIIEFENKD